MAMAAWCAVPHVYQRISSLASVSLCLLFLLSISQDCESKVILYDDDKSTEDNIDWSWGASLPFIGTHFVKRLMGEKRALRDWETAQFKDNGVKMGQPSGTVGVVWGDESMLQNHLQWQLPIMLSVLVCSLVFFLVVLIWLRNQMSLTSQSTSDKVETGDEADSHMSPEGGQWIFHPVIKPVMTEQCETLPVIPLQSQSPHAILPEMMTGSLVSREPVRIKAKGLLERRGSSASLTIDLLHPSQENLSVTPTRECTAEEYLLSVGNVLSRGQLRQCLKDTRTLHKEFWDLPLNYPEKLDIPGGGAKNRYRTIIPNENSRVHLSCEMPSDPLSGYINANYIKGYDGEEKAFIATQGPLANTVVDFWRMVWYEHSPVIVMITKLMEKSRAKCELYFPIDPGASETHSDIVVTVTAIVVKDGYVIRHITLQKDEEVHRVCHFWYDSWQDHKTPANAHSLLCLAKDVESYRFKDIQRGSTSSWPHSPKPTKSDLLSPCPEAVSPPSLKETSPVLHFGRLEFKDEEPDKDSTTSPNSENANNLVQSEIAVVDTVYDISSDLEKTIFQIIPSVPADKLNSPTFYNRSLYSNDDVFQVGSLPQKSPVQTRLPLDNFRSRSVEASVTCESQKFVDDQNTATSDVFDFDKLVIANSETSTEESTSSEERRKLSSVTSEHLPDSIEKKKCRRITNSYSPNWTSEASPNLTGSFDKSTSKLSVDSLSWGGLESPQTSSDSVGRRSSKQWTRSSEDSPHWLERDEVPTPREWLDKSPLFFRRSREGSLSFLWAEVPHGAATGPVVVHCSAGIGRTGCFIAICVGVSQLLGENNVDILGIVCRMRYDRGGMVQTAEQYEFIHRALALFERSLPDQSGE